MINGEGWLKDSIKADLKVIECLNYTHDSILPLAVKPSPNLPTLNSIRWYPSLCLFEPTTVSIGRGTYTPFEVLGSPYLNKTKYTYNFKPVSIDGMSKSPKHQNKTCYGISFQDSTAQKFNLDYLVDAYKDLKKYKFYSSRNFFYKLCGTKKIYDGLKSGKTAEEIEQSFKPELDQYKLTRKKYLLYPDVND